MRRAGLAAVTVLLALLVVPAALATKPVPPTPVPTTPSIDGAVYTTVDLNDPNYKAECHNGNPAVNCMQYAGKQYVFLNGGPLKNHLTPDGVYFFAVLDPSGQSNPSDGNSDNLSDDYDCYLNREIIIKNGEVAGVLTSTDPNCFHNQTALPTGTPHKLSGPLGPFVQLYPYADTPNNGGVYIMAVCYVASPTTTPTAPIALANPTNVSPSSCKYDAFKVDIDSTPPTCKLVLTNPGPPKSIEVVAQDEKGGSGLLSVVYSGTNIVNPPVFPNPLVVGQSTPYYIIATKANQSLGATLSLTVTDVAGNTTVCDPLFGMPLRARLATVAAGHRTVLKAVSGHRSGLVLKTQSKAITRAAVTINGQRFAVVKLSPNRAVHLNLQSKVWAHAKNVVSVSAIGTAGALQVKITN